MDSFGYTAAVRAEKCKTLGMATPVLDLCICFCGTITQLIMKAKIYTPQSTNIYRNVHILMKYRPLLPFRTSTLLSEQRKVEMLVWSKGLKGGAFHSGGFEWDKNLKHTLACVFVPLARVTPGYWRLFKLYIFTSS